MSNLVNLLKDIDTGSEELVGQEFESNVGGSYVKGKGIYAGTIERAYVVATTKGGVEFNLHITGESLFNYRGYPVVIDKKTKKKTSTYTYAGKTQTLADYKAMKQLIYTATEELVELADLVVEEQDIKFKEYGKEVTLTVGMITNLVGKNIKYSIREEEQYDYEDGETIKSRIKTDDDGNPRYKLTVLSFYNKDGKTAKELITKSDKAEQIEKDRLFLESDKALKKVKLEAPEIEEIEDEDDSSDELDF